MKFSNDHKGALYAISSGFAYGLLGYFGMSIVHSKISISNMLFWRFLVSSISIALILLFKLKTINKNFIEILKVIFLGMVFYSISSMLYFVASQHIGTGPSMVIFFTYPAIVMFLNWLLYGINITKKYYFSIVIILVGIILLADIGTLKLDFFSIFLAILSAILYASYIVFSKKNQLLPLVSTCGISIGCTLTCLIYALVEDTFVIPIDFNIWLDILAVGVICTALPILLLLQSFKYISTTKTSILSVLEPVFCVIFGVILLHEKINFQQIIGIIFILSSVIITLFNSNFLKSNIIKNIK